MSDVLTTKKSLMNVMAEHNEITKESLINIMIAEHKQKFGQ
jgi:hypothetical protein